MRPRRVVAAAHDAVSTLTAQMTLATRVAALTTVSVAVILSVLSGITYLTARDQLIEALDTSMFKQANRLADTNTADTTALTSTAQALATVGIKFAIVSPGSGLLVTSGQAQNQLAVKVPFTSTENDVANGLTKHSARTAQISGQRYRVVAVRGADAGSVLVLWQSLDSTQRALDRLTFVLVSTSLLGVLLAGAVGWGVAANGLRPVRRLTAATERVAREGDLSPIENSNASAADDLVRLTSSFNSMLRALAESQARERQLVADAGHELRTPLTSLRTNIELLTQATLDPNRTLTGNQMRELMDDVGAQLDELTALIGDLVELARDEPVPDDPEEVDLADVVTASLERVRRRAPDLRFDVQLDDSRTLGDSRSLERAVTNLLDNAAKWSPVGSSVQVRLSHNELSITDHGPGIAPEDLPRVFDRFYRSREARTLPGSGLGLSIVRRAAERHGGSVRVESVVGHGATFVLTLPAPSPVPPGP